MRYVSMSNFHAMTSALLEKAGASHEDSQAIADSLLWASKRGVDTHGAGHLSLYVRMYMGKMKGMTVNASGQFAERRHGSTIVFDGEGCSGHRVMLAAVDRVIEVASETGVAVASVKQVTHQGSLGFYVERLVEAGMVGIIFACSAAASPPFGGTDRKLGTNPISVGVPAGVRPPIIIDMATSAATWLQLTGLFETDKPIPAGLLLDDAGKSTTDRSDMSLGGGPSGEQPLGAIANIGNNAKGYALQLAVELLGGLLPALASGNDVLAQTHIPALVIGIDVRCFQPIEVFRRRVDERIEELKSGARMVGAEEILVPGERGYRTAVDRGVSGIPLTDVHWRRISRVAELLDVDLVPYLQGE